MNLIEMRERKKALGYSNETIADKSGVPLATVQKVLSGTTQNPRQKTVEALARVLQDNGNSLESLPYAVDKDGMITKRIDQWDPVLKANIVREAAAEYGVSRNYTIDDIRALPEGIRAELIDGKMYFMATPNRIHQRINGGVYLAVANYMRDSGKDCEVYIPPYGVYLHADDSEYFEPDLTVFCDHSKSANDGCHGAPDWIIEIVSPSSKANDYGKKLFKYREAGVKLYWIIDPMREMTLIYDFTEDDKTTGLYPFTEELICSLFEDLKITVADLL
ncbi:MAG: Uma2 family endonuclease [Lachnospiraceae bacterium]|nr:Uma2 family endonuclease [Lachnospiraceae bacterium]